MSESTSAMKWNLIPKSHRKFINNSAIAPPLVDKRKPKISTHTISPLQNELTPLTFNGLRFLTQPTEFLRINRDLRLLID